MTKLLRLTRRTALRGIGTSLALPWLECMSPSVYGSGPLPNSRPPVRMCYWYVPNGVHLPTWFPAYEGPLVDLPQSLQPLSFARQYLNCFSGLTHNRALQNGDGEGCGHGQGAAAFLTGAQAFKSQDDVRVGISVDQVYAQSTRHETRLPSLELGCEVARSGNAFGYSGTYKTHISWRAPNAPAPYEINPKLVFDRLFSADSNQVGQATIAERDFYRRSVLDYVGSEVNRLQRRMGQTDRYKLEQYLTSVREVERRIQQYEGQRSREDAGISRPDGVPEDFDAHLRLMCDLMVIAFQTDSTRAASFMVTKEATDRNYPWLGFTDGHHELSHHAGDAEKNRKLQEIDRYHITILAYLIEKLMATEEADGTNLLDHSLVLYGSGISDGDRHDHVNLPVIVLGAGGRRNAAQAPLRTGQHWKHPRDTPMSNLLLALLQQTGLAISQFGDSTEPLPGILA